MKRFVLTSFLVGIVGYAIFFGLALIRDADTCKFRNQEEAIKVAFQELKYDSSGKFRTSGKIISHGEVLSFANSGDENTANVNVFVSGRDTPYAKVFVTESCLGQIEFYGDPQSLVWPINDSPLKLRKTDLDEKGDRS